MADVETFTEIEPGDARAGGLAAIVVFERSGDSSEEDERARDEIVAALRKSPNVGDIDSGSQP
jgi:uncharacterized membrane protein YdfJ with MMPL/SSD domain